MPVDSTECADTPDLCTTVSNGHDFDRLNRMIVHRLNMVPEFDTSTAVIAFSGKSPHHYYYR